MDSFKADSEERCNWRVNIPDKIYQTTICASRRKRNQSEFYFAGLDEWAKVNKNMPKRSLPIIIKWGRQQRQIEFSLLRALLRFPSTSHTTENDIKCDVRRGNKQKIVRDEKQILDGSHTENK